MMNVNGRWSGAVVSACALLVLSAGCDRRSESSKAVEQSAHDLHALSGGSPEPATSDAQKSTFTKVSADLGPAVSGSNAGDKAAASLLMGQTQAGLGEQAASEAAASERAALNSIKQIQALLSNWRMRSAIGAASEAYDPSAQRADIAKSKQEKDAAIAQEQAHRSQVQGQLDDLKGRSKQKMDAAAIKETEYGRLTQQAVKMTATEAVPIVEQANKIKREADALRLEGTKLDAQAQSIAPLVTEIDAVISQLTNQKKDLDDTDAALAKQLSDAKAEAAAARADATKANVDLEKQVDDLTKIRNELVIPAYDKAVGLFTKASSAARDASQLAPNPGKAAQGDAQMSIADMHWQKAQGLRNYALLLESLAGAQPPLPKKAQFADGGKAARDQAKKEVEEASSALESAKTNFEGAGGRLSPEAKEKLDNLSKLLETAVKVSKEDATGVTPDLLALTGRSAPTTAPAPKEASAAPSGAPAAPGAADPALKSTAEAFLAASQQKKWADLAAMADVPDASRQSLAAMLQLSDKKDRLDAAFKGKFGKGFVESMSANPMMAQAMKDQGFNPAEFAKAKPEDITVSSNGDEGSVSVPGAGKPVPFKRINGKWLWSDPSLQMVGMMGAMAAPLGKAIDDFSGEVEAGKYPDANAAIAAFQMKMAQAMGMGGPPPGGGKKGPGPGGG